MRDFFVCCLCGGFFRGYGHNPAPVREVGRCCDSCNNKVVLVVRSILAKRESAS